MKRVITVLLFVVILGCKHQNQPKESDAIIPENKVKVESGKAPSALFDLIKVKHELPQNFPDSLLTQFDFSKSFSETEIAKLILDTTKIGLNEYYLLSDESFLKKSLDSISFVTYYKHRYGDQIVKLVQVKRKDTVFDLVLAMQGGDAFYHTISTKFVNDSLFVSTYTHKQELDNDNESYAYHCDSIISTYKYDDQLNLELIKADTLKFQKETFYRDHKILWSNLKIYSQPFLFQGIECVWEYFIPNYNNSNGVLYTQNLLDNATRKILLAGQSDVENYAKTTRPLFDVNKIKAGTNDINLDGYIDISLHNLSKSGTAGAFSDVYIFDANKGVYAYSNLFSGYDLSIDKEKKKVSFASRGGDGIHFLREIQLDKKSNVQHLKKFRSDFVKVNDSYLTIYSYEKTILNRLVEKVIDTVQNQELSLWEWKRKFE
ncbi:MAG: hypothetical protein AAF554_03405 [Bacteroidota bacterium]